MLLGRDAETALVDDLLAAARTGQSSALIVLGEPGVGKSALLEYAASEARDMHVLRARGMESESELAFSGLSDHLRPLLAKLRRIPRAQAGALRAALSLGPEVGADRFTVSLAALSTISAAAEEGPVLA